MAKSSKTYLLSLTDIFTGNMPQVQKINTMTKREKISEILKSLTKVEQIALLESISKEIRQKNSIRICKKQFKDLRVDDERPDLLDMK